MKKLLLITIYTIFLITLYQLVAIPLLLDLSFYGLVVLMLATAAGVLAMPRQWRRQGVVLSLLILFVSYGLTNLFAYKSVLKYVELPIMFLLLGGIAAFYGKIRWRDSLVVTITAALLLATIPLVDMPFYANFQLIHKSEQQEEKPLFNKYPVISEDDTIYTMGEKGKILSLTAENSYTPSGVAKKELAKLPPQPFMFTGFPYYTSSWTETNGSVKQSFTPVDSPKKVMLDFLDPLNLTIKMDQRANDAEQTSRQNWTRTFNKEVPAQYPGAAYIGEGKFKAGAGSQKVLLGNNEIIIPGVAKYSSRLERAVARNIVIGDVDNDGIDELLLNTIPAQIIKLKVDNTWDIVWESGNQGLQFEFVDRDKNGKAVIITQDPSLVRDKNTPYLSAYRFVDGELERQWRVFKSGLLYPTRQDGTWTAGFYGKPRIYVLSQLPFSPPAILVGLYIGLVVAGFGYQLRQRGRKHA